MCGFCLFNPSAFCIDDALDPGAEGGAGLGRQGPVQLPGLLHYGVDQSGLGVVSQSVGV
ncbi:Hypothetical protein FKW44_015833, partial [Caligus rogercresseyi]